MAHERYFRTIYVNAKSIGFLASKFFEDNANKNIQPNFLK